MNRPQTIPAILFAAFAGLLAIALWAVYGASVLDHGYIYDDQLLILNNPRLTDLWAPLRLWDAPLWQFPDSMNTRPTGFWRPLTLQVLAFARGLSGGDAWGPHMASLIIHWLAALAAVKLALRLGMSGVVAISVGVLFALHPVQVQSVAWAASINDPLLGLFSLVALNAHIQWLHQKDRKSLAVAVIAFALALLSKEQAVAVLPLAGILGWWQLGANKESLRSGAQGLIPMLLVLAVYLGLRMHVFGAWTAGLGGAIVDFNLSTARGFSFQGELLGTFAQMLAWPLELPFFRGVQPEVPDGDSRVQIANLIAIAWAAVLFLTASRKQWRTAFLLLMPALWVAPQVINYESAGAFPQSDRYLYLPVFAFAALVALLIARLKRPGLIAVPVVVIAALYGAQSHKLLAPYSDNISFFRAAIKDSPTVPVGYWSLGRELLGEYKREQKVEYVHEALMLYWQCLVLGHDYGDRAPKLGPEASVKDRLNELEPLLTGGATKIKPDRTVMVSVEDRFQGNMGQGWALTFIGELPPQFDHNPGIEVFTQIVEGFPHRHEAWIGLGMAYLSAQRLDEAEKAVSQSIQINRANPEAWFALGEILRKRGDYRGARNAYAEARTFRINSIKDHLEVVRCLIDGGEVDAADVEIEPLIEEHGERPEVLYLRGMLAAVRGQWPSSLNFFDQVLTAEPLNTDAHLQRGKVLTQLGRTTEAVAALGRVCELDSRNFEAHSMLGSVLLLDAQTEDQARQYLQRAYGLGVPGVARARVQSQLLQWFKDSESTLMSYMHMDEARGDFEACLFWIEALMQIPEPWKGLPDSIARMATVHLTAGNSLRSLGEKERAVAAFQESIRLYEAQFWARFNLGELLVELERFNEAVPHLERAMETIEQVPAKEGLRRAVRTTLGRVLELAKSRGPELMGPAPVAPSGD
ncbi:MAG: tetratricopeptide repeat protein [Planctomycetota bacterium]|nr:tetratricopeptide repeat protein [Planctomycetota bacterium]